jgi:hypothetical protein
MIRRRFRDDAMAEVEDEGLPAQSLQYLVHAPVQSFPASDQQ